MAVLTAALVSVSGWAGSRVRPCVTLHAREAGGGKEPPELCFYVGWDIFLKANRRIERALLTH